MSRREALEAAFDQLEESTEEGADENVEKGAESTPREGQQESLLKEDKSLEDAAGGEKGSKEASAESVGGESEKKEEKKEVKDKSLERAAEASASTGDGTKAPISWKPGVKEQWGKLPLDVKQEVLRREKEMSQFISQNDHHRKFTESFAKIVQPYSHLIQAQNSTPLQAVKNVFTTMAGLTLGSQEQKARIVGEIIQNYGIDIQTLDRVLSSGAPLTQQPARASIDPAIAQALQPMYGFMNEIQQARQQSELRKQQEAEALIEKHAEKPYFDDLREDMADIMEIAAKRGIEMTIDQAYDKALVMNPEISTLVSAKRAAEEAKKNGGTRLAKARRAASTIAGSPSGAPDGKTTPKNRREQLEQAWEEHAQH